MMKEYKVVGIPKSERDLEVSLNFNGKVGWDLFEMFGSVMVFVRDKIVAKKDERKDER